MIRKIVITIALVLTANSYFEVLGEKPPIKKLTEVN